MVVLAGPNGSGKSMVTDGLKNSPDFPKLYINADDIARGELAHMEDRTARELLAAQLADQRRQDAVQAGRSFAFETVMSTPAKLALFDEARAKGFIVDLIFVTTDDADVNLVRVENRVKKGGHPVAPQKIKERYERAMDLLPVAMLKADACSVFDNSVDNRPPNLVASKRDGTIELEPGAPQWVAERVALPLQQREASRASCLAKATENAPGASLEDADVSRGSNYSGLVAALTDVHVLQRKAGAVGRFTLHDRALCPPQTYQVGKASAILYTYGSDGKHQGPKPRYSNGRSR